MKIPVQISVSKVTLVKLICEKNGEPEPPSPKAEFTAVQEPYPVFQAPPQRSTVSQLSN